MGKVSKRFIRKNAPVTLDMQLPPQAIIDIFAARDITPYIQVVRQKHLSELLGKQTFEEIKEKFIKENTEWKK